MAYSYTALERFLRYAKIDTQSDPHSTSIPSTEKQKDLSRLLVEELQELGIADAAMDDWGYVYATIPANTNKKVPVICFCSHVDTSPESSGKDVKPVVHKNYQGGIINLPGDPTITIDPEQHPYLKTCHGHDIVTSDGTTLLGADNKAGVAEIMDMVHYLTTHPEVKHGTVKILFTPDEEIGRGADKVDLERLGADYGYTVDGKDRGELEDETFSADRLEVTFKGVNIHPGFAKDSLENGVKMAADFLARLPKDTLSPETTEGREGFVHPYEITGGVEATKITFIIRSFEDEKLKEYEAYLEKQVKAVMAAYPNSSYDFVVTEQYRNMKNILKDHPQVTDFAEEAMRRAGLEPHKGSIRGGTDGSKLTYMGLPCPNIFAGEQSFHSKMEWISVQDMEKAVDTLIQLVQVWEERS